MTLDPKGLEAVRAAPFRKYTIGETIDDTAIETIITAYLEALPTQPVEVTEALAEANKRAARNWRDWRKLMDAILPPGPMCRDCADADGICPNSDGLPCDPTDRAIEVLKRRRPSGDGIQAGRAEVIEECAKVAERGQETWTGSIPARKIAAAIRALIVPQEALKS